MRLCIAQPNSVSNRGSFIDNHINILKPDLELYQGYYPIHNSANDNFLKFPLNYKILKGIYRYIFNKSFHDIYSRSVSENLKSHHIEALLIEYGVTGANLTDLLIMSGIPFVVHFHGFDAYHYKTLNKYKRKYYKMFGAANGIIAVSKDMKEQLIRLGAPVDKVYQISYGVDTMKFSGAQPEKSPPAFIAVGRLIAKKAPLNTIKAFKIVHDQIKDSKLCLIGDGELLNASEQLVKELEIQNAVTFLGSVNHNEIQKYLKDSRVFVQHSMKTDTGDSEGLPNAILEASSIGLPVVSTRHAGISEAVIHEKTGFLVEEGDYKSMAEYMLLLASNPSMSGEMGRAGRAYVSENYDLYKQVDKLKTIIQKTCS